MDSRAATSTYNQGIFTVAPYSAKADYPSSAAKDDELKDLIGVFEAKAESDARWQEDGMEQQLALNAWEKKMAKKKGLKTLSEERKALRKLRAERKALMAAAQRSQQKTEKMRTAILDLR